MMHVCVSINLMIIYVCSGLYYSDFSKILILFPVILAHISHRDKIRKINFFQHYFPISQLCNTKHKIACVYKYTEHLTLKVPIIKKSSMLLSAEMS